MSDEPDDDEVPEYDEDDPDGDRREFLDSEEHRDYQELFPDEEPA
jgi:hypothetical protein